MADNGFFTPKFFDSPVYKFLQGPANERMARERAARNPLAPSQGGSWSDNRPRSTALTPQNFRPSAPPQDPNDPRRATADMKVPGMQPFPQAYPGRMAPFPPAFSNEKPILDLTVGTRGARQYAMNALSPSQGGGWPSISGFNPQPYPPENMAEIGPPGAMSPPMASAYGPGPAQSPAATAAATAGQGQPPQTSWLQDMITGLGTLNGGGRQPRQQSPQQAYDAKNFMAANAARNQDRSGIGTDGYVRGAAGNVIGRDPRYAGMSPSQMYAAINANAANRAMNNRAAGGKTMVQKLREQGSSASGAYDQANRNSAVNAINNSNLSSESKARALRNL